ncbi:hypothetical protein ACEQPO_22210 [Bacillus sp. SL00103]
MSPLHALEETEPVAEHDLQEDQVIEEVEIEDQVKPIEQEADEQTATERVELVMPARKARNQCMK